MPGAAYPRYHYPTWATLRLAAGILSGRRRSFRADAAELAKGIDGLQILGQIPPADGRGRLLTINHYCRSGMGVWWIPLAISASFPVEIHWAFTSQWRDLRPLQRWTVTPGSKIVFRRIARVYGFTNFPAMPPDPGEIIDRAAAVRELLHYARSQECPVIGLAPEGMDSPQGGLMRPYPGVGRMIAHLANLGLEVIPVGAYEADGRLCIHFGLPYRLSVDRNAPPALVDEQSSSQVMEAIAALLPEPMRRIISTHR